VTINKAIIVKFACFNFSSEECRAVQYKLGSRVRQRKG